MRRWLFRSALALTVSLLTIGLALSAEDWKSTLAKLSAESAEERVGGIRELLRKKAPADVAKPALESLLKDSSSNVRIEVIWAAFELLGEKGSELIEKLYADPDHTVRDSSIRAACRMWDKDRPRSLCNAAFEDPDFAAKVEVVNTLREFFPRDKDAGDLFRKALKDPSEAVQRSGVFGVQSARIAAAVPDLTQLAKTGNDIVAVAAVEDALATIGDANAIKALIELLPKPKEGKHPSDNVRAAAARALSRIKAKDAAPTLRAQLNDPAVIVRVGVLDALTEIGDVGSAKAIAEQLTNPEVRVRKMALRALRQLKDPSTAAAVQNVLKDDKAAEVRGSAVSCLADILKLQAIPALAALKSDLDASVRLEAAGALAGLGKPAAAMLSTFLKDSDPSVQQMAIEGMGQIGSASDVPTLVSMLAATTSKQKVLRLSLIGALGALGDASALDGLVALAQDEEPAIRQRVAVSLGQIGSAKAKPTLEKLTKDPVSTVRNAAQKALDTIAKGGIGAAAPAAAPKKGR